MFIATDILNLPNDVHAPETIDIVGTLNGDDDEIIDHFQIELQSSTSSLKAYLSQSAYPYYRHQQELVYNATTGKSFVLVDLTSTLFQADIDIFVFFILFRMVIL